MDSEVVRMVIPYRKRPLPKERPSLAAGVLKIPVEAFTDLDEDAAFNIISNTVDNHDHATGNSLFAYHPNINVSEK